MKKNLIYLLFSVTLLCAALTACSDNDDLDSTSVVRPTTTEQNDLDRWLKRNYVETYNIQLKYRFEDIESSMGYYLHPPATSSRSPWPNWCATCAWKPTTR